MKIKLFLLGIAFALVSNISGQDAVSQILQRSDLCQTALMLGKLLQKL